MFLTCHHDVSVQFTIAIWTTRSNSASINWKEMFNWISVLKNFNMRKVSLIFILLLFSTLLNHVILVFSSEFCYGEKLFRNIEEILKSQNSIELTKGISLKRKSFTTQSEHVFSDAISNCTSFRSLQDFEGRIDNVIDNFVMEFDMRNYIKGL